MVRIVQRFDPDPQRAALYTELFEAYCSLYPALRQTSWQLHDMLLS